MTGNDQGASTVDTEVVNHTRARRRHVAVLENPHLHLFGGPDGAEGIHSLLSQVGDALGMDLVLLGHVNAERYTVVAYWARDPAIAPGQGDVIPIGETFCREEITADEPFILRDAELESEFRGHPGYRKHGFRAYVGAPVSLRDGTLFGTLCGVDIQPRFPSLEGVERLVEVADKLGGDISNRLADAGFPSPRDPGA